MKIDLGKYSLELSMVISLGALLLTGLLYLSLFFLSYESYLRSFFYRCWYIQALTTCLFYAALLFVLIRSVLLRTERHILNQKIDLDRIEDTVTPAIAKELLDAIPSKYRHTVSFRRMGEILWAYIHGEEVVRLNQELSRRDVEQIEGGYLVLNALKQLIPVLGFLGTVLGLSLGMAKFPELSETAGNFESLRTLLKDLAASLSVSFDTTLLALVYTVIIVLISSFLRREEEQFVVEVDEKARQLISKLAPDGANPGEVRPEGPEGEFRKLAENLILHLEKSLQEAGGRLGTTLESILAKLEEVRQGLHNPPRYEIRVQPLIGDDSRG